MTHDTPPKRIWMTHEDHGASWSGAYRAFRCSDLDHSNDDGPNPEYPEYILTFEADAMVAAALRGAANRCEASMQADLAYAIKYPDETAKMEERAHRASTLSAAIMDLIPQPASAALDKLIAEAEARGMERVIGLFTAKPWSWNAHEIQTRIQSEAAAIRAAMGAPT